MRIRKLWTVLALVFVTGLAVHSAGAQADKKAATKTDTTKKKTAATKTAPAAVTPAGATTGTPKAPVTKTSATKASPTTTAAKTKSGPKTAGKPADASGKCKDGSYTKAATKQGACSSHGGVAEWYKG